MIPISVRMSGWMRYRDETFADFSGGSLLAICGENGAGKSSIFDAITFALYGQHRLGGKRSLTELISEDRDRLSVDLEFEADGSRYLVRRSRGRKQGERDQGLWLADGEAWLPVAGTEKEESLDLAVEKLIRLSHAAFTASFMLQQGDATAFIDAEPKPRFDIISSLIGLKEYERLERAARDATRDEKSRIDFIVNQLAETGAIDDGAIAAMRADCEARTRAEDDAATLLARAKAMLADAQRFSRLSAQVAALDTQIAAAAELLAARDRIEADARLYATFAAAVDAATRIERALADARTAEAAAANAQEQLAAIDVQALSGAREAADLALDEATAALREAETAHAAAQRAEREASDFAAAATGIVECRERLAGFDERIAELNALIKQLATSGKKLATAAEAARAASETADAAFDVASQATHAARARNDALKSELAERKAAAKEATCKRCGQAIDKAGAKRQVDELTAALAEAAHTATSAVAAERAAAKQRDEARTAAAAAAIALAEHQAAAGRADGERAGAATSRERAAGELAAQEARVAGRLKDVATAAAAHATAQQALAAAETTVAAARATHTGCSAAEADARRAVDAAREQAAALETTLVQQTERIAANHNLARTTAAGLGELSQPALDDPAGLLATLRAQQESLAGAPGRKAALDKAQSEHDRAAGERTGAQAEIDAIPAGHRVDQLAARGAEAAAEGEASAAREARQAAERRLAAAEAKLDQAAALQDDKARAEVRHKRLRKLTTLLGKKGLQGILVQGALTTVTHHANAFLRKLTGGTLELTLEREGDALELRAIDHTCMREARSAKALSGSQKFRCAVAIASGIGQYAGAGGMRSIVIDEGFGSLDAEGQRLMVEELKQLAQHMDKVIVVSHLEAFTDPANFPDRLEVRRLADGTSSIARVEP